MLIGNKSDEDANERHLCNNDDDGEANSTSDIDDNEGGADEKSMKRSG